MRGKLTDFNIVKRIFDECGLELISDKSKYETCHSKLDYICKKHRYIGAQQYSFNDVRARLKRNTCGCPECSNERNEHKTISGIYLITNTKNNKKYVGQSWNIFQRWTNHRTSLRGGYHGNTHLQNAWNKYGEDNFTFEILKECGTQEELNECEINYIAYFNSANQDFGYNDELGGNGAGKKTEEFKNSMSLAKRGVLASLSKDDVRHIKMMIFLGIDRKEIFKQFNTNRAVVTAICTGQTYSYILPELIKYTKNIGEYYRNIRKEEILSSYDELGSISKVVKVLGYSQSVVEKTIYANRKIKNDDKYRVIYQKVFELHNKGVINYDIAKQLHISPSTVGRYLNGQNIPYRIPGNKKMNDKIEKEIIELYRNGCSLPEISRKYDMSNTTIRGTIDKYKNIENYYEELAI